MVRTTVPLSFEARGLGIDPRFPILQELKVESTSTTTLGSHECLLGFPLGLEGLVQPKGSGTLRWKKKKKKRLINKDPTYIEV